MNKFIKKINEFPELLQKLIPVFIWRTLINLWSLTALIIFTYEFVNGNPHPSLTVHMTMIYIGVLTIYVGTKEFRRWHNAHQPSRYGEFYVFTWTMMIITFAVLDVIYEEMRISHDLAALYISIISIYAITRESKRLHEREGK